uniref:Uncharacterized protein n=1 Tax=Romanomermis culicivorax TaxID=13658 RepID=A0A915L2E0_ROMCU
MLLPRPTNIAQSSAVHTVSLPPHALVYFQYPCVGGDPTTASTVHPCNHSDSQFTSTAISKSEPSPCHCHLSQRASCITNTAAARITNNVPMVQTIDQIIRTVSDQFQAQQLCVQCKIQEQTKATNAGFAARTNATIDFHDRRHN